MNVRQYPNSKTDLAALVAAARSGDQDAFTALYEATNQDVYRSIRALLRSEELALDIQQDAFVYAFSHLDQLGDPAKFRTWVRNIAVNQAKTALRKQNPVLFTELENEEGEGLPEQADLSADASPELNLDRKETARLVNEILDGLSDGQRAAVGMYYYQQMSVGEIAEALRVTPSTVKVQLVRGRKKIEEAVRTLEKQGVKLYGLSPLPFLLSLMKGQSLPMQQSQVLLVRTLAQTGLAAGTKTAASAAPVMLQATKPFFSTVIGKVVLGVVAAGVVTGGAFGFRWARNNLFQSTDPILTMEKREELRNDPTSPTVPVVPDVTGTVELDTTEPVVSEPMVSELVREQTDMSEIRSAFAEVVSLYLVGESPTQIYIPANQSEPGWQTTPTPCLTYSIDNRIDNCYFDASVTGYMVGIEVDENGWVKPVVTALDEEPAEPDQEAENTAFLSITGGAELNDNVLGVICNGSALEGTAPTVVWNEGEQDPLVICPRYPGSTVEARWFQRFEGTSVDMESVTPRFTVLCRQGDSIGAALERPAEDGSGWLVTVRTPDGQEGGWILTHNSQNGTPAYEYLIGGSYDWESEEDKPSEYQHLGDYFLNKNASDVGYDYQFIFNRSSEMLRSLTRPLGEGLLCSYSRILPYHNGPTCAWNEWIADEGTFWTVSKSQMQGDTCCTEAAVVHEYYMEEIGRDTGIWAPRDLSVEETAVRQAELFAERRLLGYVGVADEDVVLHFDLTSVRVYNPTLNAKTVSITVNGQEAGSFSLTEGDFFTMIPLDYPDLPGDHAVRVEARVTECSFGTPEQAVLVLWPNLNSIFVGGR